MAVPAIDVKLGPEAEAALARLEAGGREEAAIARRVRALGPILRSDCLHGEAVAKASIPKALRERHGVENLRCEDLPGFWRLLYTVVQAPQGRLAVVLEIVDHRQYDRWFPNKGH